MYHKNYGVGMFLKLEIFIFNRNLFSQVNAIIFLNLLHSFIESSFVDLNYFCLGFHLILQIRDFLSLIYSGIFVTQRSNNGAFNIIIPLPLPLILLYTEVGALPGPFLRLQFPSLQLLVVELPEIFLRLFPEL